MSTKKFTIRSVLRAHLVEMDDLPAINWEMQLFTPPEFDGESLPYIRETMLHADETLTANNERTGIGIYRLDLMVPMGHSILAAENLADKIKEHFRPAQNLGSENIVTIERSFVGQNDDSNPPWVMIPVSVDYRAHSPNLQPA